VIGLCRCTRSSIWFLPVQKPFVMHETLLNMRSKPFICGRACIFEHLWTLPQAFAPSAQNSLK